MPYWQLYYHVIWSTKNREPLITAQIEPVIYGFLRHKAVNLGGNVYALNGVSNHVHLVASIPPNLAISKFIGQIKAVASVKINKSGLLVIPFYWQEEYGIFSLDKKRLPNYISYVDRQKEHHENNTVIPILENDVLDNVKSLHETSGIYRTSNEKELWDDLKGYA